MAKSQRSAIHRSRSSNEKWNLLLALPAFVAFPVHTQGKISAKQSGVMSKLLVTYAEKATVEIKEEKGRGAVSGKPFTVEAGWKLYVFQRIGQSGDFTRSGCHAEDPRKEGRHIQAKTPIKPLASSANPERFY